MFMLEIGCHVTLHRIPFETKEEAYAQLEALRPHLGKDYLSRNDQENKTFTIRSPSGDVVVVCEKVEVARVSETSMFNAMVRETDDASWDVQVQREIRRKLAFREAGLEDK